MRREILTVMLASALLGSASYFTLPEGERGRVTASLGSVAVADALEDHTTYFFEVDPTIAGTRSDSLSWFLYNEHGEALAYTMADNALERSFDTPGRYVLQVLHRLRVVAQDTFTVVEGERFVPIASPTQMADTLGATFRFSDASRHVKGREWTVRKADSVYAQGDDVDFAWTATDTGAFTVQLKVTMRSSAEETDAISIMVEPPPQPEPVVTSNVEKRQLTRAELDALAAKKAEADRKRKEREDALRQKREQDKAVKERQLLAEKKRKAEEAAAKTRNEEERKIREAQLRKDEERSRFVADSIARIKPPCFSAARLAGGEFTVAVANPVRTNAKFRSGAIEFTIEVTQDCRLTGFKHFGNENAGSNKITVQCLDDDCDRPSPRAISFIAGQDADSYSVTPKLNMPVFVAGRSYRVKIETTGTGELGFFTVPYSGEGNDDMVKIKFSKSESCIFDLVFAK